MGGGTDRNQRHRQWIWVDGTSWDFDRWFDHGGGNREPNNDFCTNHRECTYGTTADCAVLEVSGKLTFKGFWLDTFCTDKLKYVCSIVTGTSSNATNDGAASEDATQRRLAEGPSIPSPPPASPLPPTLSATPLSSTPLTDVESSWGAPPSPLHVPPPSTPRPPPSPPVPPVAPSLPPASPPLPPPIPP